MTDEPTRTLEVNREELQSLGMALALFKGQEQGMGLASAVTLMMAMEEMDHGVFRAHLDRLILRFSLLEDELIPDDARSIVPDIRDRRAHLNAHLDQVFAEFEEEGRTLFPERQEA